MFLGLFFGLWIVRQWRRLRLERWGPHLRFNPLTRRMADIPIVERHERTPLHP